MIRRTLVLGLLFLAGVILGLPALVGVYLARHFDSYLARLEQPGVMRVIGTRYVRGWFQSEARVTVQLADRFCGHPPCASLTIDSTIYHGPLPFLAPVADEQALDPVWALVDSRVLLAPLWPDLVFEPPLKPLHIVTRVELSGDIHARAWLPAARMTIADEQTLAYVDMARLTAVVETSLRQVPLRFEVSWPLLRINGAKRGQVKLQGLQARLMTAAEDHGRIVEQHLRIGALILDNGKGLALRLEQIVWRAGAVPGAADAMATRFKGRIERLIINSGAYGPLVVRGRIQGVDAGLWRRLRAQFIAGQTTAGPDTTALKTLYKLYLPPVLATAPVIEIRHFSLTMPVGTLSGRLRISIPDDIRRPESLLALLERVGLAFKGRVPDVVLRRIIRYIATRRDLLGHGVTSDDIDKAIRLLAEAGLIQPLDGGSAWRVHVSIGNGRIRIGGKARKDWAALLESLRRQQQAFGGNQESAP